jgi:hypothetical protein
MELTYRAYSRTELFEGIRGAAKEPAPPVDQMTEDLVSTSHVLCTPACCHGNLQGLYCRASARLRMQKWLGTGWPPPQRRPPTASRFERSMMRRWLGALHAWLYWNAKYNRQIALNDRIWLHRHPENLITPIPISWVTHEHSFFFPPTFWLAGGPVLLTGLIGQQRY